MKNSKLHLSIAFGEIIVPIIKCEDGTERVPLKPICDEIGLDWKTQKRKLLADDYLIDRFGLILGEASLPQMGQLGLNRDQYLIRVDRVTAFLNTLNPRNIKTQGNKNSAKWLEAKHSEWDDVLHQYETYGTASNGEIKAFKIVDALAKVDRMKNATMRQISSEQLNAEFDLNIPISKQATLDV